jgi:queuine tRNA-ribosyltransferase
MAWDRPILTDSGGFQVVSLGELRKIDDDGVTFQSHLDGSYHRFTPELSIEVQEALGADVAVAFDQPVPPASTSPSALAEATVRSNRWAARSLAAHSPPGPGCLRDSPGRSRSGPSSGVHAGGGRPAVRRHLHRRPGRRRDAGPARGDARRRRQLCSKPTRAALLDGSGLAIDLLEAVHRGVDLFDCVLPARVARNGQLWVPGGRLNMRNAQFVRRPAAGPGGLPLHPLPQLLARLSGPSVPGRGAAGLPAGDLSQPDLHPRLHGRNPLCTAHRHVHRAAARASGAAQPSRSRASAVQSE